MRLDPNNVPPSVPRGEQEASLGVKAPNGGLPPTLVLASASPRRRELLAFLGMPFKVHVPEGVDEGAARGSAEEVVATLARWKAEAALGELRDGWAGPGDMVVIGADTVVAAPGDGGSAELVLGKADSRDEARGMLERLLGRTHRVLTGVALATAKGPSRVQVESTLVTFRSLDPDVLERHLDTLDWEGKAGAYGIQGEGGRLLGSLEGCYYNVVGLPLTRLAVMLAADGVPLTYACGCADRPGQRGARGCGRLLRGR